MAEALLSAQFVVVKTATGIEFRIDGQRRVGSQRQTLFRVPLSRTAAHKLAIALLNACVPDEVDR